MKKGLLIFSFIAALSVGLAMVAAPTADAAHARCDNRQLDVSFRHSGDAGSTGEYLGINPIPVAPITVVADATDFIDCWENEHSPAPKDERFLPLVVQWEFYHGDKGDTAPFLDTSETMYYNSSPFDPIYKVIESTHAYLAFGTNQTTVTVTIIEGGDSETISKTITTSREYPFMEVKSTNLSESNSSYYWPPVWVYTNPNEKFFVPEGAPTSEGPFYEGQTINVDARFYWGGAGGETSSRAGGCYLGGEYNLRLFKNGNMISETGWGCLPPDWRSSQASTPRFDDVNSAQFNLADAGTYTIVAEGRSWSGSYGSETDTKSIDIEVAPFKNDIKANNSDGPITVAKGDTITLSWETYGPEGVICTSKSTPANLNWRNDSKQDCSSSKAFAIDKTTTFKFISEFNPKTEDAVLVKVLSADDTADNTASVTIQKGVLANQTPGNGTITGPGVNCGNGCSATYPSGPNEWKYFEAVADAGSVFDAWGGCDSTNGSQCGVNITDDKVITAYFHSDVSPPVSTATVTAQKSSSPGTTPGTGTVTGDGVNCGGDCSETYPSGPSEWRYFYANADPGSTFAGWAGCDITNVNECIVNITNDKTITAYFTKSAVSGSVRLEVRESGSDWTSSYSPDTGNLTFDLRATVTGNNGPFNFTFYCDRSDSGTDITTPFDAQYINESSNPKIASKICNYGQAGSYTPKVIAVFSGVAAEDRASVAYSPLQCSADCNDGIDNDGDGFTDYPDDEGCEDAIDNNESDDIFQYLRRFIQER